jgi:hypothetical protein
MRGFTAIFERFMIDILLISGLFVDRVFGYPLLVDLLR